MLCLFSFFICIVAVLFPPKLYSFYIHEPNRMFLNFSLFIFYSSNLIFLMIGVKISYSICNFQKICSDKTIHKHLGLLIFLFALSCYATVVSFTVNRSLIYNAIAFEGQNLKNSFYLPAGLNVINFVNMGVVWWGIWLWRWPKLYVEKLLIVFIGILTFVASIIKLSRGELYPLAIGCIISSLGLFASKTISKKNASTAFFIIKLLFFLIVLAMLFLIFSIFRGSISTNALLSDSIGYIFSPFNRLASILDGSLVYKDSGKGIYLFPFAGYNNVVNSIFNIRELFNWPSFETFWLFEFVSVANSGLNGYLIWSTAAGYVYSDIGYMFFLYWIFVGFFIGVAWQFFRQGTLFGFIFYPWVAFCLIFWFGMNFIFDTRIISLIVVFLLIKMNSSFLK